MKNELWLPIPGHEDDYHVSNYGRVRSVARIRGYRFYEERILRASTNQLGYKRVKLSKDGKQIDYQVHRLVALAFIGEESLQVNHKDLNPGNNHLENLEYVTASENTRHSLANGRGRVVYSKEQVDNVVELIKLSIPEKLISWAVGMHISSVWGIKNGRNMRRFYD